jgi:mono/diheme cytochrome c family protein
MRRTTTRFLLASTVIFAGCGSNVSQLLVQSATAVGQTLLDQWLTDLANALLEEGEGVDASDQPDDASNGDAENPFEGLTGDAANGQALYADLCASCHCADAVGGCLLDAPGLLNAEATLLDAYVRGEEVHPIKRDLTDQDIADLAAFLVASP